MFLLILSLNSLYLKSTVKIKMETAPATLVRTATGGGRVKKEKFTVTSLLSCMDQEAWHIANAGDKFSSPV